MMPVSGLLVISAFNAELHLSGSPFNVIIDRSNNTHQTRLVA